MKSNNVRFWEIRPNKIRKGGKDVVRSYTVRWSVAGREKSQTFERKAQAERHKAKLIAAAERESFDVDSGLPDSMRRERSFVIWYDLAGPWPVT